jgi:hypothetical protein
MYQTRQILHQNIEKKKRKITHVISSTTEIFIFSLQIYDAIYLCGYIYFLNYLRQRHNVPVY